VKKVLPNLGFYWGCRLVIGGDEVSMTRDRMFVPPLWLSAVINYPFNIFQDKKL